MNYKRHKPRTQVRCTYCTSNRIGNSGRIRSIDNDWRPIPAQHPSWYCKKSKGKHSFYLKKEEEAFIISGIIQTYLCNGCGKKKLKFITKQIGSTSHIQLSRIGMHVI